MHYSFRPLSRWIGSYTGDYNVVSVILDLFPAPLKVDRFLY